jgi:hypothetical protein
VAKKVQAKASRMPREDLIVRPSLDEFKVAQKSKGVSSGYNPAVVDLDYAGSSGPQSSNGDFGRVATAEKAKIQ